MRRFLLAVLAAMAAAAPARAADLVVWAWERPEDLRFVGAQAEVAVQTGFINLSGARMDVRGRRFPLRMTGQPTTAVVHVQIDPRRPLERTPDRARAVAQAVLRLGAGPWVRRLQIDFEVRASERPVLMAVLHEVRAGLPPGVAFSMTALASWCDTESWLADAPVDEVVPMLFRMGPAGAAVKARLAAGGDFANPRCRSALAVSADAPIPRAPAGRRVYLFSPRSWTPSDFETTRRRVAAWSDG